jgi:hypothetical protein
MGFFESIGPFVLAVIAVIINGVPQLLYAEARGFALKPAGFAYLVGAFGNLFTGSSPRYPPRPKPSRWPASRRTCETTSDQFCWRHC